MGVCEVGSDKSDNVTPAAAGAGRHNFFQRAPREPERGQLIDSTGGDQHNRTGAIGPVRPRVAACAIRPSARLSARVATLVGLSFIALIAAVAGAFLIMLSRGPISFPWLAPRIAQSMQEIAGPHYAFALKNAALANGAHGPTLSVDGLVVKFDERAILAAPRAEVSVDLASLLVGRVKLRRLEALDLEVRLSVQPDGSVAISAGGEAVTTPAPPPLPAPAIETSQPNGSLAPPPAPVARATLLREAVVALRGLMALATSRDSQVGALDRVGVAHGKLIIDDRTIERTISYNDVALVLDKGDSAMRFALAAAGPSGRWTVSALAKGAPGGRRDFHASVRGLSVDEIALVAGFRNAGFDTDAPLGFDFDFALGADDSVVDAGGRFEVGGGFFRLDDPDHEPVRIERITGASKWDKHARKLVISPLRFIAGGFDMALSGDAHPATVDGVDAWALALRLDKPTIVKPERASEKPVTIETAELSARLLRGQRRALFDKFAITGPDTNVTLDGALSWADDTRLALHVGVVDSQIPALARLWPTHVASPVRAWFVEHIPAGTVKRANYVSEFDGAALTAMRYQRPPPDVSLLLEGEIANGSVVDVLPGMAPLTGVRGHMRVTGRTATFAATSGVMETAPGRRMTLAEGTFSVPDFALRPTPASVDMRLSGHVDAVADVLALPVIAKHAGLPVDPQTLKGQVDGRLRVEFEMVENTADDSTSFFVDATASNLTVDKLIGKERLEGATLHVQADKASLHVNGSGHIFGAPANLELRRATGDKTAQAQMTLNFDEAARQRAGYVFSGISGAVAATIRTPLPAADFNTQIDIDLARTTFDNPVPGLVKPAGKAAKASFALTRHNEGYALERFEFDAGSAQAQGVIELSKDGVFRSARLTQARLSPGDDMRADISRNGEVVKIVARGANLDARPMLQTLLRAGPDRPSGKGSLDDFDLDFKAPIVTGHNKQILANVDLKMERRSGRPRALALAGNLGREHLNVTLARNDNGAPQLEISTNDGGSFLSFLDLYRKMDSGVLTATVQLGDNRADGAVHIRDYFVRGEPTMRQLMAQTGAMRADERGNARFDPELVKVGRLQSDFSWSAGRLSLREGVMSGPEIGLTFDGFIDFPRDRMDLSGAYIPAYALNSLLSNIPVLGVVLAGGRHEGVFALNYRVTGAMSAPVVNVNPLSAIAPGLMRKMMSVLDGTGRAPGR